MDLDHMKKSSDWHPYVDLYFPSDLWRLATLRWICVALGKDISVKRWESSWTSFLFSFSFFIPPSLEARCTHRWVSWINQCGFILSKSWYIDHNSKKSFVKPWRSVLIIIPRLKCRRYSDGITLGRFLTYCIYYLTHFAVILFFPSKESY